MIEKKTSLRFLILLLLCLSSIGTYLALDMPAVLYTQLIKYFSITMSPMQAEVVYGLLFTVYNLPNMFLPVFGGALTDHFGMGRMTLAFLGFVTVGQFIFTMGVFQNAAALMIFGRFVFGIGGESINITATTFCIKWFQGNELSFAQSVFLAAMRLASIGNTFITPAISNKQGLYAATYFGLMVTIFSLVAGFMLVAIDAKFSHLTEYDEEPNSEAITPAGLYHCIKRMNKMFWMLTLITTIFYIDILSFLNFVSRIIVEDYLPKENKMEYNQEIAGQMMSVLYISCTVLLPFVGAAIDKKGMRVSMLYYSSFLNLFAFILLLKFHPLLPLFMLGVSYSIAASIVWPTAAFLVPSNLLGLGYGLMTAIQNGGLGLAPLLVVALKTYFVSNTSIIYFFIFTSILTIWLCYVFVKMDAKRPVSLDSNDQIALLTVLHDLENSVRAISLENSVMEEEYGTIISKEMV